MLQTHLKRPQSIQILRDSDPSVKWEVPPSDDWARKPAIIGRRRVRIHAPPPFLIAVVLIATKSHGPHDFSPYTSAVSLRRVCRVCEPFWHKATALSSVCVGAGGLLRQGGQEAADGLR